MGIASLVLGIVGLLAWLLPLAGFPITIVGLTLGLRAKKSGKSSLATAGIVLNIIGLVATAINSALGAYLNVMGRLF
jgi:hypothetical protein